MALLGLVGEGDVLPEELGEHPGVERLVVDVAPRAGSLSTPTPSRHAGLPLQINPYAPLHQSPYADRA
jgi:hypothetical protein